MYYCALNIIILSKNNDIEQMLSKQPLPEDCSCCFETAADLSSVTSFKDTAVIIDCSSIEPDINIMNKCPSVLLAASDSADKLSTEILSAAAGIWLMPTGILCDSRLISVYFAGLIKQMKLNADYRHLKICFDTSIDSLPDLIWYKDTIGAHLAVNNGFCKAVEKTKEQIYKKGHYYIWDIPKEEYDQGDYVCLESESIVMAARRTCLFDEKVKTKSGMRQFKTYKSPLIDIDGEIFGTCGVARDVTDLHNINSEVEIILESIPFAMMIEDDKGVVTGSNSKFSEFFPDGPDIAGKSCHQWKKDLLGSSDELNDEAIEIRQNINGTERYLSYRSEPITDIFNAFIGRVNIFRDITLERNYRKQTLHTANTDFLTALNNRRSLFAHLAELKYSPHLAFVMVDLDNFKKVNDTYGHQMGDKALFETAKMLKQCFREDFIARLGGDEFIIVIDRQCSSDSVEHQARMLLDVMCSKFAENEAFRQLSASIGIASKSITDGECQDTEQLMRCSDEALYCAKSSGKAQCCIYTEN